MKLTSTHYFGLLIIVVIALIPMCNTSLDLMRALSNLLSHKSTNGPALSIELSFILENDTDGTEFFIESEESFDSGGSTIVFITSDPTAPAADDYKIKYVPGVTFSCEWCRSNVMRVTAEVTPELVAGFGGSGDLLHAAFLRLETKIRRLVPVHVRLGGDSMVLKTTAAVTLSPTVTATVTETP